MSGLTTPQAIVVGAALIGTLAGAGAYFGSRARAPTADPTATTSAAPAPPVPPIVTPAAATASTKAEGAAVRERVARDATAAIEKHRAHLKKTCWEESAKKSPAPAQSKFVWNITFDAQGKQLARGITEEREGMREGLGACVSQALPSLEVQPPGTTVQVDVSFTLP